MRTFPFIILASVLISCTGGDFIRSRAEHFVRSTYRDVDKILYYSVDTVTLGDNMNYRIEQAKEHLENAQFFAERLKNQDSLDDVAREAARLQALDSLLVATEPDILNTPAAYQCCIAYNTANNLVWLQLDPYGKLLVISKDRTKMYLNPGNDIPGYLEVNERFSKLK